MLKKDRQGKILGISISAILLALLFFSLSFQSGHSEKSGSDDQAEWPKRRELFGQLREIRKLLVVYGTGNPAS
ncbi:hypothetical protein MJD09_20400, partial [bacterium]|nr:hypothetical protein [bacterium]